MPHGLVAGFMGHAVAAARNDETVAPSQARSWSLSHIAAHDRRTTRLRLAQQLRAVLDEPSQRSTLVASSATKEPGLARCPQLVRRAKKQRRDKGRASETHLRVKRAPQKMDFGQASRCEGPRSHKLADLSGRRRRRKRKHDDELQLARLTRAAASPPPFMSSLTFVLARAVLPHRRHGIGPRSSHGVMAPRGVMLRHGDSSFDFLSFSTLSRELQHNAAPSRLPSWVFPHRQGGSEDHALAHLRDIHPPPHWPGTHPPYGQRSTAPVVARPHGRKRAPARRSHTGKHQPERRRDLLVLLATGASWSGQGKRAGARCADWSGGTSPAIDKMRLCSVRASLAPLTTRERRPQLPCGRRWCCCRLLASSHQQSAPNMAVLSELRSKLITKYAISRMGLSTISEAGEGEGWVIIAVVFDSLSHGTGIPIIPQPAK
ncbi:hypothetical protein PCL_03719 [Purpureocillium lilacinum]|uniref:Uncharacterized protein n=1 Tax=Purpureocillium lilacinum TaxID=33203 RepID=A0A2U3EPV5_PURLI|nr:hypothetical protein PCL_03719 [Purpureocillium lilacinum]